MSFDLFARNPQPWARDERALERARRARLREIIAENRHARQTERRRCKGCGCTPSTRCLIDLGDGDVGACASAGDVPGHRTCSACLTPERRISPNELFLRELATLTGEPR